MGAQRSPTRAEGCIHTKGVFCPATLGVTRDKSKLQDKMKDFRKWWKMVKEWKANYKCLPAISAGNILVMDPLRNEN